LKGELLQALIGFPRKHYIRPWKDEGSGGHLIVNESLKAKTFAID
jgi:hypothetical protein